MENFKDIPGYEGLYQVSPDGQVRSLDKFVNNKFGIKNKLFKGRLMKPLIGKTGYYYVQLVDKNGIQKHRKNHRLVALTFIPNPENKPFVNHINGNKLDNRIENLEWCTASENNIHAVKLGLLKSTRGSKNGGSKLNEGNILEIRRLHFERNYKQADLAILFDVVPSVITAIVNGRTWRHVEHKYLDKIKTSAPKGEEHHNSKLTKEIILEIRHLHDSRKMNQARLAEKYNIRHSVISRIVNRKSWAHV